MLDVHNSPVQRVSQWHGRRQCPPQQEAGQGGVGMRLVLEHLRELQEGGEEGWGSE